MAIRDLGLNENGPIVDILLERADRILAKDGGVQACADG